MAERKTYTGMRCKTVDRTDNKYKMGTIVKDYATFKGRMVDIAFDDDKNQISTEHFLEYVILKDTEEE